MARLQLTALMLLTGFLVRARLAVRNGVLQRLAVQPLLQR